MRDIKFRGKRIDNGEWAYGDLFKSHSRAYIITLVDDTGCWHDKPRLCYSEVDPETVGQFTGLLDKNRKEIYEGDIVHCIARLDSGDMVVIFEDGEFRMVLLEKYKDYVTGMGFYAIRCFTKEVIGNIHDK